MVQAVNFLEVKDETHDAKSFLFEKPPELDFVAGQYLRYRLDHPNSDGRGITRPFSISSSPTENYLMFTTKFTEPGSSFKKALLNLRPGDEILIEGPKGEFTLPEDRNIPVVLLGGGVGITPFRSMVKWATDEKIPTKLTLIYANKTPGDIIYRREFDEWARVNPNFNLIYTVDQPDAGWAGEVGRLTGEMIKNHIPDQNIPLYYICGPEGMINAYREILGRIGVPEDQIRTENFTGY